MSGVAGAFASRRPGIQKKLWPGKVFYLWLPVLSLTPKSFVSSIYSPPPAWRRERALIVLGLRAGLRLTSMLSLRIGNVAIVGEVQSRIRIRRRTTNGRRAGYDMPLHPQAATALQDYLPGVDRMAATPTPKILVPSQKSKTSTASPVYS